MRLAYLCTDFGIPVHGSKGASIHVRELSRALRALGHEVEIFAARAGGPAPPEFHVPVHEIALAHADKLRYDLLRDDPAAGEVVAKEVRSMLFTSTFRHQVAPLLQRFAPNALYERYSLQGTAGLDLAHDLDVPLILEVNAPLSAEQATHRGLAYARTARAVEWTIARGADHVVAVSAPLKEWLVSLGVAAERVTVLPNGVDTDRFAAGEHGREATRARLGIPPGTPIVGFVGTLKAWHGTATLVDAVAALHRESSPRSAPHLLVVGEGPQRADLAEQAAHLGIAGATTFTGTVPHDEIPAYIGAMDVAVAPYDEAPDFYFSPLKLFEYMAAGRPVVAAAIGQITDCIRHQETGLLYPPGDRAALAAAIAAVLGDPAWAAALGRAGRAEVQQHHTWIGNARAVSELAQRSRRPAEVG
ncbi:MAG: glycosyltransferase [Chloroflexia bacterium]|nr:glycosyltransferase [Chloroflexia bacterium]